MTEKQVGKFMDNPNKCPFCGSDNLDEHDFDGDGAECDCDDCGESWMVEYRLIGCYQTESQCKDA